VEPEDRVRRILPWLVAAGSDGESEALGEQLEAPNLRVDPKVTGWVNLTPTTGSRPVRLTENPRATHLHRSSDVIGSVLLWFDDEGYVSALEWLSYTDDDGFPDPADLDQPS
jgi:hypothetical protein